jgi:hypothetical protein
MADASRAVALLDDATSRRWTGAPATGHLRRFNTLRLWELVDEL